MKQSAVIALVALLLVGLGCNLDRLTGRSDEVPTPVPGDSNTITLETPRDASPADTGSASGDVSMAKFNRLEFGMSYDEVQDVMGSEGNQTSMSKGTTYETASYEWKGDGFARISVRISNGELVNKSQSGLTPPSGSADIDQAKFNRLNVGMSYDEVREIIGSEGEMSNMSKIADIVTESYRWKGEGYSNIFVTFRDGKLQSKSQARLK